MNLIVTIFAVVFGFSSVLAEPGKCEPTTCPNFAITAHYRELGCAPIFSSDDNQKCCPTAYDCTKLDEWRLKPDKCYFRGREYGSREQINASDLKGLCSAACFCQLRENQRASFICADVECPYEAFGVTPDQGCYLQYDHEHCCSVKTMCPPIVKNVSDLPEKTCSVDGIDIKEGQKVYPDSKPYSVCICLNGELDCRPIECGIGLRHQTDFLNGAAPVYYGRKRICPISYLEPSDGDAVEAGTSQSSATGTCKFGKLDFKVGECLAPADKEANKCTKCDCLIPPMLSCIQDPTCE